MKILDRYLLRQFFRVFVMVFVSLLGIYVVADFVGNLTEFVDHGKQNQSLGKMLMVYYGARVPWFFDIASRNVAMLSAVFSLAWLQRDNEMTALMAAGISRWRIAKPLIVASALIAVLAVINRELWIPRFRTELCRNAQDMISLRPEKVTPRYDVETDVLFDGQAIFPSQHRIDLPRFRLPVPWRHFGQKLQAESAHYVPAGPARPAGYLLDNVESTVPMSEVPSLTLDERPLVITAHDDSTLTPQQAFLVSRMSLDQLRRGRKWQQFTKTASLISGLKQGSLDYSPDVRLMIHARFVQPLMDITLVFLGIPLALGGESRRLVSAAAKSIAAGVLYGLVVLACHGMGIQCVISPALAAWTPLIVMAPVAILLSEPLRR